MAELIDPFERELRRRPRRNDGLMDDGRSYRVSDDFGKMWGEALADYEARTGTGQRSVALTPSDMDKGFISRVESAAPTQQDLMDNPRIAAPLSDPIEVDALRHQLFDPLMQRFGSDRQTSMRRSIAQPKQAIPRITKAGSDTYMEDPLTREWKKVVTGPRSASSLRITPQQQSEIRVAERELTEARKAMDKIPNDRDNVDERGDAVRRFRKAQQRHSSLVAPPAEEESIDATVAEVIPSGRIGDSPLDLPASGTAFMGDRGGPNMIQEDFVAVVNPSGKATRVKSSDLDRALKQGYKRR